MALAWDWNMLICKTSSITSGTSLLHLLNLLIRIVISLDILSKIILKNWKTDVAFYWYDTESFESTQYTH